MALRTDEAIQALRKQCDASLGYGSAPGEPKWARNRRVSKLFAEEMRKRGWIDEEGYALGSWAAQGAR